MKKETNKVYDYIFSILLVLLSIIGLLTLSSSVLFDLCQLVLSIVIIRYVYKFVFWLVNKLAKTNKH